MKYSADKNSESESIALVILLHKSATMEDLNILHF